MKNVALIDRDDNHLAPYRALRERDRDRGDGTIVLEGEVVLRHVLSHRPGLIRSVLLAANREALAVDARARLAAEVPVLRASRDVMSEIVGFPIHRGVLAIAERRPPPPLAELIPPPPARCRILVAVGIANHDNVGALFRNAAAFGATAVLLDETSCDPLYRKTIRVSVGHSVTLPFLPSLPITNIFAELAAHGIEVLALSPRGAEELRTVVPPPRAALIVGAEGSGLPQHVLRRCRTVAIPMAAGVDSLNVATAAAIVLHHLASAVRSG